MATAEQVEEWTDEKLSRMSKSTALVGAGADFSEALNRAIDANVTSRRERERVAEAVTDYLMQFVNSPEMRNQFAPGQRGEVEEAIEEFREAYVENGSGEDTREKAKRAEFLFQDAFRR